MGFGGSCGLYQLLVGPLERPVREVFPHRAVEEVGVLADVADRLSERVESRLSNVLTVDANRTRIDVVQPQE